MRFKFNNLLIVLTAVIVTMSVVYFLSLFQLLNQVKQQFFYDAEHRTDTVADLIKSSLILSDYHEIQKISQVLVRQKVIRSVEVRNVFDEIITDERNSDSNEEDVFKFSRNLTYDVGGKTVVLGSLTIEYTYSVFHGLFQKYLISLVLFSLLLLGSLVGIFYFLVGALVKFVKSMNVQFVKLENNDEQYEDLRVPVTEFDDIFRKMKEVSKRLILLKKVEGEKLRLSTIEMTASQVAHDIQSPLAALSAATQGLSELPEDKRIMIRSAVQRIGDIANDLAGRGKQQQEEGMSGETVQLLSGIIDALISEKRLQFRSRLGVNIQSTLEHKSYGLFAKVDPAQFKRALSNLVNNAVEALADQGTVSIAMKQDRNSNIIISVNDTGAGIPSEILSKLTQKGATFGKKAGQGLGLYHARESVESWGGSISIDSKEGQGTTVTLTLPMQSEPNWFVPELVVFPCTQIIILDDDDSIHQIWKGRFETKESGVKLHHFSNGGALREWYARTNLNGPMLILCDYEILGSDETGLNVIEGLGLADSAVLVTSRFEEQYVRAGCERLGIRLLPKNLAGFVPIKWKEIPDDLEFVLIDDNRMNRRSWEIMARAKNKKILTFERPRDFYDVAERINKDAKIYVDLNLGAGISGKDVTREISTKGFEKIFLYTGADHVDTTEMPWIKGVVGKDPPFLKENH